MKKVRSTKNKHIFNNNCTVLSLSSTKNLRSIKEAPGKRLQTGKNRIPDVRPANCCSRQKYMKNAPETFPDSGFQ